MAKGYTQRQGIDYGETYAPVVTYDSLRVILSTAAALDLELIQLDIKTAFLYGHLEEELYLEQPDGFIDPKNKSDVCLLKKSIYGLKQAPRMWNQEFNKFLVKFGLTRSTIDPCVYFRRHQEEIRYVAIWVDDGLVCSNNRTTVNAILEHLKNHFDMRIMAADRFVGLEITRRREDRKILITQSDFITKILNQFKMESCHPKTIPSDPSGRLTPAMAPTNEEEELSMQTTPYQEAVGCLMYLTSITRPDIAFATNQVARFSHNPGPAHWEGVKRILSYLSGTRNHGLCFSGSSSRTLTGFTDAVCWRC